MTGALSPVMALSSTEATPSIDLAVAGDDVAGLDEHDVALAERAAPPPGVDGRAALGPSPGASAWTSRRVRRSASAWALPRPSAIASAKLANSTVNQSQTETPKMKPAGASPWPRSAWTTERGRQDAADEHDEHHRVADLVPGVELPERVDDGAPHDGGSNRDRAFGCVDMSGRLRYFAAVMQQVLDDRTQRERRDERQRADEEHHADQQHHEQRRVRRQRAGARRDDFFRASEPAIASIGIASQ